MFGNSGSRTFLSQFFFTHLPIPMTINRLEGFPKSRMVCATASKSETGPPYNVFDFFFPCARKHHQLPRELQAVAEFTNDPDARSHVHYHNMRLSLAIARTRAAITGWGEERHVLKAAPLSSSQIFPSFPRYGEGYGNSVTNPVVSARPLNGETLCSVPLP